MAYLGMVLASLTLKMRQYLIFEKKKKKQTFDCPVPNFFVSDCHICLCWGDTKFLFL